MSKFRFLIGYGFDNCNENDNYEVHWSEHGDDLNKKEFKSLSDSMPFFDSLDHDKALINKSILDKERNVIICLRKEK